MLFCADVETLLPEIEADRTREFGIDRDRVCQGVAIQDRPDDMWIIAG